MTLVLFWDIDGTLLTTLKAGQLALQEACRAILGREVDFSAIDTRGVPDTEIAARILQHGGQGCDDAAIRSFLEVYEHHLPSHLGLRRGGAMPGVVAILERLDRRRDVMNLLLTGNTPAGARAKLEHYGLARFFERHGFAGGFADGIRDRVTIARRAIEVAEERVGERIPPERRYVIGDTPHDIACGQAIEARTIAVATGGYSVDELAALGAWIVWPELPDPETFEAAVGRTDS